MYRGVIERTFFLSYGEDVGTGFTIEQGGHQFLISSKHVFDTVANDDIIDLQIYFGQQWNTLRSRAFLAEQEDDDIIIFFYNRSIGSSSNIAYSTEDVYVGLDSYFIGFPYGKFVNVDVAIHKTFPFPFVKKGVVSAIDFAPSGKLYLDGHTNPGFSGGPVTFSHQGSVRVFGIVRSYLPHEGQILTEFVNDEGTIERDYLVYDENSGIIVVEKIDIALVLLTRITDPTV